MWEAVGWIREEYGGGGCKGFGWDVGRMEGDATGGCSLHPPSTERTETSPHVCVLS